ncbi:hypothetical protein BDV32DRAFT_117745 [Aspergillus pseudonomiae]|uniref:Uncharacterized protein n=1 Tax=Aspergillus pseudonomiae TaxID=1506151 RepID=A0A5N6IDG9_9EURO|nr:uncharacterized protein BDV37DRAFT_237087 [Aspergillus pseudonomiae]KAB8264416.1 hypothetical protein BDV32DRAFT_117745 [Aspergillus pseudonomiae]KAE8409269.1 hypothetical protein BDV37DRAFT_237087 [Aspergillus pseudonomiae]
MANDELLRIYLLSACAFLYFFRFSNLLYRPIFVSKAPSHFLESGTAASVGNFYAWKFVRRSWIDNKRQ